MNQAKAALTDREELHNPGLWGFLQQCLNFKSKQNSFQRGKRTGWKQDPRTRKVHLCLLIADY